MENNKLSREDIKKFVLENKITEDNFKAILKRFDLENINLEAEHLKIQSKSSYLSARQRKAVEELVLVKSVMDEINKEKTIASEAESTVNFNTI